MKIRFQNKDYITFLLIFTITFSIYSFTSHGHRNTPDEYYAYTQAHQIVTQSGPHDMIPEETRIGLEGGGPWAVNRPHCHDMILCALTPIGYAVSYTPFIIIEQNLHIIPNFILTEKDFDDPFYVWWRNSQTHEETFTFLFYGPIITALSVSTLFFIGRTYKYSKRTSIMISLLYGFSTIEWAYNTTAFNSVGASLFILLGFLFYRKFRNDYKKRNLAFSGLFFGYGFLVRYDVIFFIIVIFVFLLFDLIRERKSIKRIISFTLPLVSTGIAFGIVNTLRFGSFLSMGSGPNENLFSEFRNQTTLQEGIFGLLFSPGVGIFIFSPILLTIFISFFDFYKKNKYDLFVILGVFVALLVFYGNVVNWDGFVAWGARYMLIITPLLLIPLGASLENRKSVIFKISTITLAVVGIFFNFSGVIQDTTWFVWGHAGGKTGLYSLANGGQYPSSIHPATHWTFEYSQLTQSIILEFTHLQPDLFLFKILSYPVGFAILASIVAPSIVFILRILKSEKSIIPVDTKKESNSPDSSQI